VLDYKDNYLLNLLISSDYNLTISDIQKLLGVSKRSAYYSISKINDYLESVHLPKLVNKRQVGIIIEPNIKEKLASTVSNSLSEMYVYTSNERIAIEIMVILSQKELYNIPYFEELFMVSRNTIVNDFKEMRKWLNTYNLSLTYDSFAGYQIEGLPIRKRSVLLNIISTYEYVFKINSFDLIKDTIVTETLTLLRVLEKELNIKYVNTTLYYLSILISIIKSYRLEPITLPKEDEVVIKSSHEFGVVKNIVKEYLPEEEYIYLTLHLLGLRIQFAEEYELKDDDYVTEIVELLISEFSKETLIYFDDEKQLFDNLYTHMKQAMFRFKYGIIYQNELKDQILQSYPQVYSVTRKICNKLETQIGYPIGEDDVTFIAMHFGGYLKREHRDILQTKVLLVCLNGVATSKLLRKELEYLVGNIDIIDAVTVDEIEQYKNEVNYIISTIPIKNEELKKKILVVNPILTDLDKANIISLIGFTNPSTIESDLSNDIVEEIKEYIPKDKVEEVRKMIMKTIRQQSKHSYISEGKKRYMLKDLIKADKILFKDQVDHWEQAIIESGAPLLKQHIIEQRYIEKVISNVKELGPYICIAPLIAISHARPEDGANELGMTIMLLKEPVSFKPNNEKPIRVVVTLAAPDNEKHLLALQQLSRLLMEDLETLLNVSSKEDVLRLVEKYSGEEE
jgi:transcriptional antiterminator/mannitol/fructose-specific phosphotransferase system IIA component (Ntr-type)